MTPTQHERDITVEHTRIRARLKRLRQLLTLEDADVLIAIRQVRLQEIRHGRVVEMERAR